MELRLKGKKALITGGTRSIGRAIVEVLSKEGVNIAFCARNGELIDETVAAIERHGVRAFGSVVDVSDAKRLESWIREAAEKLDGIDILVPTPSAQAFQNTEQDWVATFNVDLMGVVRSFGAALPYLERAAIVHGDASVVALGTISACEATQELCYGPLKAALIHFCKGAARQHAPKHIRVNVVSPGGIYSKDGVWRRVEVQQPEVFKAWLDRVPIGRMGTPLEIANAVAFLASPLSGFTTGSNFVVDGGMTVRVGL